MKPNLLILSALLASPADAQPGSVSPGLPKEVQQRYDVLKADCRQAGGKFVGNRHSFAQKVEVTNDGRDDWVIEYAATRCTAFGHSAHCGTAGCSIEILGSTRTGLATIYNDNVREWEVVDVGQGRKGLQLAMHGTVCDSYGAEVCRGVLAWNGRKWDLISKSRGLTDAEQRALEAEAAGYEPPERHSAKWFFGGKGADAIAAVTDHPSFAAIGVRCYPGGGLYLSAVPRPNFAAPPPGRELQLAFTGYVVELEWTQSLRPAASTRDYNEVLPDVLRDLLAGEDQTLGLLASVDGGDEWQELDELSLAGSSSAIRALQIECAKAAKSKPTTIQVSAQTRTAPAQPSNAVSDEAAIRGAVDQFYRQYGAPFSEDRVWQMPLSPDFRRAWDRALGPNGAMGADPFCQCQDYEPQEFTHRISRVVQRGDLAEVTVRFKRFRQEEFSPIDLVMARQADGRWLIDDVTGLRSRSLKAEMLRDKAGSWAEVY